MSLVEKFVWTTDTHTNDSVNWPNYMRSICQWVKDNAAERKIKAFIHTGDFVTLGDATSFAQCAADIALLPIPPEWLPGNHDADTGTTGEDRNTARLNTYLPISLKTALIAAYDPTKCDNTASMVTIGGRQYLLLSLEFCPRDPIVAWADALVKSYPTTDVILGTHSFLASAAGRETPLTPSYCHTLVVNGSAGDQLWLDFVQVNSNIRIVLSGHLNIPGLGSPFGAYRLDVRSDGSRCHQFGYNFQSFGAATSSAYTYHGIGGTAFLFEFELDHINNTLRLTGWNPAHNLALPGGNVFVRLD